MGSTTDKIKGHANEAAGKVKQRVGKAVGNDRLRAKGAQEIFSVASVFHPTLLSPSRRLL